MPTFPYYRINAFIDPDKARATSGNPAAIVLLTCEEDTRLSDEARQALATEINLSETAFVTRASDTAAGSDAFSIRWFTPGAEVKLCGHATLAAGRALTEAGWAARGNTITFSTRLGEILVVRPNQQSDNPPLQLRLPLLCARRRISCDITERRICKALGIGYDTAIAYATEYDTLVVTTESEVRGANPDMEELKKYGPRGVIVCARAEDEGLRFVSRFFAPSIGVAEDAVTGSAHCVLSEYYVKAGESVMARQLSSRGGLLQLSMSLSDQGFVWLGGWTEMILSGCVHL